MNEGSLASPYWTPTDYDQSGLKGVHTDFRDVGDVAAVAGSDAEVILESGLRVFGDGIAENDSGLTVAAEAEEGNLASILTTNETAHVLALSMGDTTMLFQPDTHETLVIDVEFTNNTAITARAVFLGFCGALADALVEPVTGATTTITLVADDVAGALMDSGLTDGDGIFLPHNKSNEAASIATSATGVDVSSTMPAAGTFTRWRVEITSAGVMNFFVNKVLTGSITAALDVDEEVNPVFYVAANAAAIKQVDIRRIAMWANR